jgi:GNAT superfamily N-acetyltransferase
MPTIRLAETDADIVRCFPVMQQLRLHLDAGGFVARVRRMQGEGFALAFLEDDAAVVRAVGGFCIRDMLAHGRTMYVDDLVTDADSRSRGYGAQLLRWLATRAGVEGCHMFSLDSGTHRRDAHRFYFRERMHISSYHFALKLAEPPV